MQAIYDQLDRIVKQLSDEKYKEIKENLVDLGSTLMMFDPEEWAKAIAEDPGAGGGLEDFDDNPEESQKGILVELQEELIKLSSMGDESLMEAIKNCQKEIQDRCDEIDSNANQMKP